MYAYKNIDTTIRPQSWFFKIIVGMQSALKYPRISSKPQHIPIHYLSLSEKVRKNEQAGGLASSWSEKNKEVRLPIVTNLFFDVEKWPVSREYHCWLRKIFFITMFKAKGSGLTRINLCILSQRQSFIEEKLCCV